MGVACLEFRGENFRRWLKNREIREDFLPRKFPTIRQFVEVWLEAIGGENSQLLGRDLLGSRGQESNPVSVEHCSVEYSRSHAAGYPKIGLVNKF